MGKGGVFGTWSIFLLKYLSICPNKCVWLRDRKKNLIYKNKPSGGKDWSKYAKIISKNNLVFNCFDVALLWLLSDVLAWITKKGEIEREMCHWAISIMFWWLNAQHVWLSSYVLNKVRSANHITRYVSRLSKLVFEH